MSPKEAYKLSFMWHRLNVSEQISVEQWEHIAKLFIKHGYDKQWFAADNSLRMRIREGLSNV